MKKRGGCEMKSDKCLYCIGDAQSNEALIDEEGVVAYLHHRELRIEVADIIGYTTDVDTKINYCPMCGGKLEEAE